MDADRRIQIGIRTAHHGSHSSPGREPGHVDLFRIQPVAVTNVSGHASDERGFAASRPWPARLDPELRPRRRSRRQPAPPAAARLSPNVWPRRPGRHRAARAFSRPAGRVAVLRQGTTLATLRWDLPESHSTWTTQLRQRPKVMRPSAACFRGPAMRSPARWRGHSCVRSSGCWQPAFSLVTCTRTDE